MLELLPLETSFQQRKLHLGYRRLTPLSGPFTDVLLGHEFHYAVTLKSDGPPLFSAQNAEGEPLADMGLSLGNTHGSFAHIIDQAR